LKSSCPLSKIWEFSVAISVHAPEESADLCR
jgi:hypothetical protein